MYKPIYRIFNIDKHNILCYNANINEFVRGDNPGFQAKIQHI